MKFIAIDLGSNMALAHNGFDDVVVTDFQEFKGIRAHRAGATFSWLDRRFTEIVKECRIHAVVYERPFARGMDATRCLWGLAGIIECVATNHKLAVLDLDPQSIKKFSTGKGSGKKPDMLAAAQRLGYQGDNEHEADAYCLLKCALSTAEITRG